MIEVHCDVGLLQKTSNFANYLAVKKVKNVSGGWGVKFLKLPTSAAAAATRIT